MWDFGSGVELFLDNRMCMGLSSSSFIFTCISDFVVRCCAREGVNNVVNYLDDFAILCSTQDTCAVNQGVIISILRWFGSFISFPKLRPPSTCNKFLGIEIDSVALQLWLPIEKILKLKALLLPYLSRRKVT